MKVYRKYMDAGLHHLDEYFMRMLNAKWKLLLLEN